ncbi:MAG: type II secretion system F family protein [Pseudomonadota bacterium]
MNRYNYKAINDDGKYVTGRISAENPGELEVLLKNSKLYLISHRLEKSHSYDGKLSNKQMISMFSHLEQLDKAGVSIIDAISDVKDSAESIKIRNLMQEIYESLRNGSMLSDAFAKHPNIFSRVFIGLISTGERTGNLHSSFKSIVEHLKWTMEMKRKTTKAIRYPLFSLFVMMVVLGVMTTVVVPKVTEFLRAQEIALPFTTRALIAFSDFAKNNSTLLLVLVPTLVVAYKIINNIASIGIKVDEIKLHIPFFGSIITKIDASRFCHFFSITFKSGLGVLDCLESAKEVINNRAIKNSIDVAKQQVSNGKQLAMAISYTGHFPGLVVRMFEVGETSGNMEEALDNIRFFYDQEINDSIDKMVGMIQPALTLIMGGMMAWITIAVFGPIYSSFGKF